MNDNKVLDDKMIAEQVDIVKQSAEKFNSATDKFQDTTNKVESIEKALKELIDLQKSNKEAELIKKELDLKTKEEELNKQAIQDHRSNSIQKMMYHSGADNGANLIFKSVKEYQEFEKETQNQLEKAMKNPFATGDILSEDILDKISNIFSKQSEIKEIKKSYSLDQAQLGGYLLPPIMQLPMIDLTIRTNEEKILDLVDTMSLPMGQTRAEFPVYNFDYTRFVNHIKQQSEGTASIAPFAEQAFLGKKSIEAKQQTLNFQITNTLYMNNPQGIVGRFIQEMFSTINKHRALSLLGGINLSKYYINLSDAEFKDNLNLSTNLLELDDYPANRNTFHIDLPAKLENINSLYTNPYVIMNTLAYNEWIKTKFDDSVIYQTPDTTNYATSDSVLVDGFVPVLKIQNYDLFTKSTNLTTIETKPLAYYINKGAIKELFGNISIANDTQYNSMKTGQMGYVITYYDGFCYEDPRKVTKIVNKQS